MKVIASWDDAAVWDLRLAELMTKYEIPTIFYWPVKLEKSQNVSRVTKFLTMEQCKELAKTFEVGSHTVHHPFLTKVNTKQARNEIFDSRKMWQDLTGQSIDTFCYPRGYSNSIVELLVKNAGYKEARGVGVGSLEKGPNPFKIMTTLHVGIDRTEYQGICWQQFADKMIEKTDENSLFHIMGHSWEIERENDWADLEDLLKKLTGR